MVYRQRPGKPPNLLNHLSEALSLVKGGRLGLAVDFDGTVSEVAPTPADAEISPPSAEALEGMSRKLTVVSVVSGRSAEDLRRKVGLEGPLYAGNHGAEYLKDGRHSLAPGATAYKDKVRAVFEHLRSNVSLPGLVWQDKDLSASVHYRLSPDADAAKATLSTWFEKAPGADDLEVFWGKLVMEIRAPIGLNKGYAIRKLVRDWRLRSVIFLGDDTTDVDALEALRDLTETESIRTLGVAVIHADSPEALIEAADYSLNGVPEVGVFLGWLDEAAG